MRPYYLLMRLYTTEWMTNSVDPDQTPHHAASDLSLHSVHRPVCHNTMVKYMSLFLEIKCRSQTDGQIRVIVLFSQVKY